MFKKFNKLLLGGVLIGGVMSRDCTASMDGSILSPASEQIKAVSPDVVAKWYRESQKNLLSTAIGCLKNPEFLESYLDSMSQTERGVFLSESLSVYFNIMAQMNRYEMHLIVHAEPTNLLQQRIESEERDPMGRQTEVTIGEFNRQLYSLPVRVDELHDSCSPEKIKNVNDVLIRFVQLHSQDKDYEDLGFLIGLLKMLHCFPMELSHSVTDKMPEILESIGYTETSSDKSQKEIIYDYILGISEESLGEFHI